jgi:type IV pilus modification protein PilV
MKPHKAIDQHFCKLHMNSKKSLRTHQSTRFTQKGVGLIEVIVAILLLATGLLGAVALQFATAKEQRSSQFVSRAALLANEIGERMRANRAALDDPSQIISPTTYLTADTQYVPSQMTTQANSQAVNACTAAAPCLTALSIQSNDITQWQQSVTSALPQGAAMLLLPTGGGSTLSREIVIAWVEPVMDKDSSGAPRPLQVSQSGCPPSINPPVGVRCYRQRFVL